MTAAAPGSAAPDRNVAAAPMLLSPQRPQSLEKGLAHHIGPRAHHLMKRAAATAQEWEPLVGRLAAEIDFDPARAGFISACRMLSQPTP